MSRPRRPNEAQHPCLDCPVLVDFRALRCRTHAQKAKVDAMRRSRARRKAEQPVPLDESWTPAPPIVLRVVNTPPPDPSPSLAAQSVTFAVTSFMRITHDTGLLAAAVRGTLSDPEPHAAKLTEAVRTYLRVGGTDDGLDNAIRQGSRAAGNMRQLPSFLGAMTPEEAYVEDTLATVRSA